MEFFPASVCPFYFMRCCHTIKYNRIWRWLSTSNRAVLLLLLSHLSHFLFYITDYTLQTSIQHIPRFISLLAFVFRSAFFFFDSIPDSSRISQFSGYKEIDRINGLLLLYPPSGYKNREDCYLHKQFFDSRMFSDSLIITHSQKDVFLAMHRMDKVCNSVFK